MDSCTTRKTMCAVILGFTLACVAAGLRVATAQTSPDLVVAKSASANSVFLGQSFSYLITATNGSNVTATNVVVTDVIPSGLEIGETSARCVGVGGCLVSLAQIDRTIIMTVTQIGASSTATMSTVVTPMTFGQITNTAFITASTMDASEANNVATATVTITGTARYLPLVLKAPPATQQ